MPSSQELQALCQEKLYRLQEARLLENRPIEQMVLEKEIKETKEQCLALAKEAQENLLMSSVANLTHEVSIKANADTLFSFINRHLQFDKLKATLKTYTEFEKPLFCVIYGCKYEILESFIQRLKEQSIGRVIPLRQDCTQEELELQLKPDNLIFYQTYDDKTCRKQSVKRILEEIFLQWQKLQFANRTQPILFCILLKHAPDKKAWWKFWGTSWKTTMCSFLTQLSAEELKNKYGVNVFILPELKPVPFNEVQDWINFYLKGDGYLINKVDDEIYRGQEALAMQHLVEQLKPLLNKI